MCSHYHHSLPLYVGRMEQLSVCDDGCHSEHEQKYNDGFNGTHSETGVQAVNAKSEQTKPT